MRKPPEASEPPELRRAVCAWQVAYGTKYSVLVRSPDAAALQMHMKAPASAATANMLLSPMPGTLLSLGVAAGAQVYAGQELCVVEAMKMQNVLSAERRGVIKSVNVGAGDALKVDAVILEFEDE